MTTTKTLKTPKATGGPQRPPGPTAPPKSRTRPTRAMQLTRGRGGGAQKIVMYGPGGVGKTELCSLLERIGILPVFIDPEASSAFLDVARIEPTPETLEEVIEAVHLARGMPEVGAIVVDSLTKVEELADAYTLRTVRHEKGHAVTSIEGYGFGKGFQHVYESFLLFLQALDAAARDGKHILATAHDCTASVPNPAGEDWIRYEPRLQAPKSGKGSIRHRVKEWCDHLFYIGFDTYVTEDGKAQGSGTRTIHPVEMPTHWAKSRKLSDPIPYDRGDATLWKQLFDRESEVNA